MSGHLSPLLAHQHGDAQLSLGEPPEDLLGGKVTRPDIFEQPKSLVTSSNSSLGRRLISSILSLRATKAQVSCQTGWFLWWYLDFFDDPHQENNRKTALYWLAVSADQLSLLSLKVSGSLWANVSLNTKQIRSSPPEISCFQILETMIFFKQSETCFTFFIEPFEFDPVFGS